MEEQKNRTMQGFFKKFVDAISDSAKKIFGKKTEIRGEEIETKRKQDELETKISSLKSLVEEVAERNKAREAAQPQAFLEKPWEKQEQSKKAFLEKSLGGGMAAPKAATVLESPKEKKPAAQPVEKKPQKPKILEPQIEKPAEKKKPEKEERQKAKIERMIEAKKFEETEKIKKELKQRFARSRGARKAARKRKKKHEEIVERLEKIEEHISVLPKISARQFIGKTMKRIGGLGKILKLEKEGAKPLEEGREAKISWEAGKEIVSTLKRIEKKTRPIRGRILRLPESAKISIAEQTTVQAQQPRVEQIVSEPSFAMERGETVAMPSAEQAREPQKTGQLSLDEQIELTKRMVRRVRYEFFKRQITEEEFKHRTSDLEEKLRLLEEKKKILSERKEQPAEEKVSPTEKPKLETPIGKIIERKARGQIEPETMKNIATRLQELAEKYNIPQREIAADIEKINANKILGDFDKLINIIEMQYKEKTAAWKKEEPMKFEPIPLHIAEKHKMEKTQAVEKEIEQQKLETDFDRIANLVKEKGAVTSGHIAKELKINIHSVRDCCNILEQNGMIQIEYPPIGDVWIIDREYQKNHKHEAEKKLEAAKKQKTAEKKPSIFPKISFFGRTKENKKQGEKNA